MALLDVRKLMSTRFVECILEPARCIDITLPWPPTVNHTWIVRGSRVIVAPKVVAYRNKVLSIVRSLRKRNYIHSKMFECPVAVLLELRKPDKRKRDIDNVEKQIYDSLTKAGIWEDDSQVVLVLKYFGENIKGGAVNVFVAPLEV